MYTLTPYQTNAIDFVMVDVAGTEVPGLGAGFALEVNAGGTGWAAGAGVGAELGNGWYRYILTALESVPGDLAVRINGAGCVQQNLAYRVGTLSPAAIAYTYTLTDSVTLLPVAGAEIWFYTDLIMSHLVWYGTTDAFGVARDSGGNLPFLDAGTYYIRRVAVGFTGVNPDTEIVS